MRKSVMALAIATLGALSFQAKAGVVCDSCDYLNANIATNLGLHNPTLFDNSTFSNATTGTNGNFSNLWVFAVNPAGMTAINAIFLPIQNISNFAVELFRVTSDVCAANTGTSGGACTSVSLGSLLANGITNPQFATEIDFTTLAAGIYAFDITGTISGLVPNQPASYTGNLQVLPLAVPEPGSFALAGLALVGLFATGRKKKV